VTMVKVKACPSCGAKGMGTSRRPSDALGWHTQMLPSNNTAPFIMICEACNWKGPYTTLKVISIDNSKTAH